ncbi:MAG: lipocalin-like domain-containing protein [Gammaproteobacteria bacterium]
MSNCLVTLLLILYLPTAMAQGSYQMLRGEAQNYAQVSPGKLLEFPRDHNPHPDFRLEWWYITANLKDDQGQHWGLQWTLFRQALDAKVDTHGWDSNQLWMAHAAISSPQGHRFEQRFARGGIDQAGVENHDRFIAWLDDWQWQASGASMFPAELKFSVGSWRVEMQLDSASQWVLHGDRGYSQKSAQGQASYYFSQPNISIRGVLRTDAEEIPLSGQAWLDREWSSQPLAQNQTGWDWFSLHFSDGNKLMLYRLREDDGDNWLSGTLISANGETRTLQGSDIELVVLSRRSINVDAQTSIELPLEWAIKLPQLDRQWRVKPLYDAQWMATRFAYWEGVVLVEDEEGRPAGEGYMELTGYE